MCRGFWNALRWFFWWRHENLGLFHWTWISRWSSWNWIEVSSDKCIHKNLMHIVCSNIGYKTLLPSFLLQSWRGSRTWMRLLSGLNKSVLFERLLKQWFLLFCSFFCFFPIVRNIVGRSAVCCFKCQIWQDNLDWAALQPIIIISWVQRPTQDLIGVDGCERDKNDKYKNQPLPYGNNHITSKYFPFHLMLGVYRNKFKKCSIKFTCLSGLECIIMTRCESLQMWLADIYIIVVCNLSGFLTYVDSNIT